MKKTFLLLTLFITSQLGYAQANKVTKEAIGNLNFMEGIWKGIGWIKLGERKQQIRASETLTKKSDGLAVLAESFGAALDDSNNIIYNSKGILSYNEGEKKYILKITLSDGSSFEPDASLITPSAFEWKLKYDGGHLKYIHEVKDKIWMVKGFHSSDGMNWDQIVEMKLSKQ